MLVALWLEVLQCLEAVLAPEWVVLSGDWLADLSED